MTPLILAGSTWRRFAGEPRPTLAVEVVEALRGDDDVPGLLPVPLVDLHGLVREEDVFCVSRGDLLSRSSSSRLASPRAAGCRTAADTAAPDTLTL